MKFGNKTALGIDVSEEQVHLALLKKTKKGFKLLKTATCPVPDGAIKNGNIEDPAALTKAIKKLQTSRRMKAPHAVVSPPTKSILVQIMDMPSQISTGIRQFVQEEIRNYVVLANKDNITLDFCAIDHDHRQDNNRLFVAAADGQMITNTAKAFSKTNLNVEDIEPSLLAYIRAFHGKKIASKFACNILLAIIQDGVLTLCVFKNQSLDFIITKSFGEEKHEPDELCHWLADQMNAVVQFYDIEFTDNSDDWEVTVVTDNADQLPTDAEESLKSKVATTNLQVRTPENVWQDTVVEVRDKLEKPSPVAVGLAMKALDTREGDLKINLFPQEIAEVKSTIKHALVTTNIVIAILLIMIGVVDGPKWLSKNANKSIVQQKQERLSSTTHVLIKEHEVVDKQIKQLTNRIDRAKAILDSRKQVSWPSILDDIRNGTPTSMRITRLAGLSNSRMFLEGVALSHKAVHLFVDMLNKTEHIDSASLVKTEKGQGKDGVAVYEIDCSLTQVKEKADANQ